MLTYQDKVGFAFILGAHNRRKMESLANMLSTIDTHKFRWVQITLPETNFPARERSWSLLSTSLTWLLPGMSA